MKIVLNKCYGGYSLSKEACNYLGIECDDYNISFEFSETKGRTNENLVKCVEELGAKASGRCADLEVVEIPDNSFYKIEEYDGYETVYYSESKINTK